MEKFIAAENVRLFERQLLGCTDEGKRQLLAKLLAEERQKLRSLQAAN